MMLCVISYWVLSGAKRRQIQQLRCCVLPTKLLKRRDVYLKPVSYTHLIFLSNNGIADEKIIEKQKGLLVLLLAEVTEFILMN